MIVRVLMFALALGAGPAKAAQLPAPGPSDSRVRVIDYDPWQVVTVHGALLTATQIQFADDETILHAALGDSAAWELAAEGHAVFLRPRSQQAATNLIVTTRRGGAERHYTFALSARAAPVRGGDVFVIRFRYPLDAQALAASALAAQAQALEAKILKLKLERAVVEGPRNLNYRAQGASSLQPSEVSDNGRFTVLRFPANQGLPAIYQVDGAGIESLARFDVRGEFVVIPGVMRQLRLRQGREVLCLYNQAFDPYGERPASNTAAADVERTEEGRVP